MLFVSAQENLQITELIPNFYIYTTYKTLNGTPFPSNGMYFITENKEAVLIDTPWDENQTIPLLDSIKRRHHASVIACLVTHSHDDRTAGLDYLKELGIPTFSTQKTYETCMLKKERFADNHFFSDTTFNFSNISFTTFFPGEGHSPDNIVLYFKEQRLLYGGCFIKSCDSQGLGNLSDADTSSWKKAMKKVKRKYKNVQYVIPGHFGWNCNSSVQHTLRLLRL